MGLSYLQSSHQNIFLANAIIVFVLLGSDNFFFHLGEPAAPSAPRLIRPWRIIMRDHCGQCTLSRLTARLCDMSASRRRQ